MEPWTFATWHWQFRRSYLTARVSTEFRRHGIPSVFFTSVSSVFRAELAAIPAEFRRIPCGIVCNSGGIPPNSMSYNSVKFRGISWNSVTFFMYGIPYISKETHIKVYSMHRVPECLSLRWNWVLPRLPSQASVSPLLDPKGGSNTRLQMRGPNSGK
jgi:hypothetical protein